jgi:DNA-binding CsgD family transcriptional regulator
MPPATTPLIGRDEETAALSTALAATWAGSGGCHVISGPAGIGKTRLLEAAVGEARQLDLAVAVGRATPLDRAATLTTLMSTLHRAEPEPITVDDLAGQRVDSLWYLDRVAETLELYAARRPLVIAVDDAQWADELSALALRVLVPALASSPVRWFIARRATPAESPARDALDWLVATGADELRLRPLEGRSIEWLCRAVLGAEVDATVLGLAERAGGNPFLIERMLRSMSAAGQILVADGVATAIGDELPSDLVSAVTQRLQRFSPTARTLLEAGAIFERPFRLEAAGVIAGVGPAELLTAAAEATAEGILVADGPSLTFCHDLDRRVVYDLIPPDARAALHAAAADLVGAEGRPRLEVAQHRARTGPRGNRAAVEALTQAVAELAPNSPGTAADVALQAMTHLSPEESERTRLAASAVGLLTAAGRLVEARRLGLETLEADLDPGVEATVLLGLAEAHKHAGDNRAAAGYARTGLAGTAVPPGIQAHLHSVAAHALLWGEDIDEAEQAGADAERLGLASGEFGAAVFGAAARSVVARAHGQLDDALGHAVHAVDLADRHGREARHRHPRIWLGSALSALDRLTEAQEVFRVGREEADSLGTRWSQPLWHFYSASARAGLGDLDDAKVEAEAGQLLAEQLTARQLKVPLLGLLARIAALKGQLPAGRQYLRNLRDLLDDGVTAAPEDLAWAQACVDHADDRPVDALSALRWIYDSLPDRLLLFSTEPGAGPELVRIAMAAGDDMRADAATSGARILAERNPSIASVAAAAHHAEGLRADDVALLEKAVTEFESSPRVLDRARAFEDCAQAHGRRGDRSRALELLNIAIGDYQTCGAAHATRRAERLRRSLGIRSKGGDRAGVGRPTGLTERELHVAELVAEGHTNKEIARVMTISGHTVDTHLRHIFTKLNINSRVELTRYVLTELRDDN